jgi:hypothetical protein
MTDITHNCKHYFVDEAGDLTFFNKKKQIIVGEAGCSQFFMVGMAEIAKPAQIEKALNELRDALLNDPYFRGVPSMRPEDKKTAICFHAKDDLPEVRREVFKLLQSQEIKITIAIRRKREMAEYFKKIFAERGKKFSDNDIYDDLTSRIFKGRLHKADECAITFAHRGKSERRDALFHALEKAKLKFEKKFKDVSHPPLKIQSAFPSEVVGLQVIDYFLWAIQRMFERNEDRFFGLLASQYRLIMDIDDRRKRAYGEWYSDDNRCELQKIKPI